MAAEPEFRELDAVLLGAVHREVAGLFDHLPASNAVRVAGEKFRAGKLQGLRVMAGTTGLGKVNAGITAAVLLSTFRTGLLVNVGCAGAYPEAPLHTGDVLLTDPFLLGDEGVLTRDGPRSTGEIGIPVLSLGGESFFDSLPADTAPAADLARERVPEGFYRVPEDRFPPVAERLAHLPEEEAGTEGASRPKFPVHGAPFRLVRGPGLTVSLASGDAETAAARFRHFGAFTESMEGSALAQACYRLKTPFIECRGVSNVAGNRDWSTWRIDEASRNALGVALRLIGLRP